MSETLTAHDLDDIEAQMTDTTPWYVPTLLRELREARAERDRRGAVLAEITDIVRDIRALFGDDALDL